MKKGSMKKAKNVRQRITEGTVLRKQHKDATVVMLLSFSLKQMQKVARPRTHQTVR